MRPEDPQPPAQTTTEEAHPPPAAPAERGESSLQYVRDVLTGKVTPRPLAVPPPVKERLQGQPLSEEARQWLSEELSLQYYYGGQPIATIRTKDGGKAVLASGHAEIAALVQGVPYEECRHILFEFPEPW
jgi:hypothetical protein